MQGTPLFFSVNGQGKCHPKNINEVRTYCRIVTALKKTIEIQQEIDELYLAVEDDLITWPN